MKTAKARRPHAPCPIRGLRVLAHWALGPFLSLALVVIPLVPGVARANPVPSFVFMTHVHDDDGEFCSSPPAMCPGLVQATERDDILAFDLIASGILEELLQVTNIEFRITYPEEWGFVRAEACGSGIVSAVHEDHRVAFFIEDLHGAPQLGEYLSVARIVLDVTSEGMVFHSSGDFYGLWSEAWAGVECGHCTSWPCASPNPVRPALTPSLLQLVADENGEAIGQFHIDSDGSPSSPAIEEYTFEVTVPWISLGIVSVGDQWLPAYDVAVHAHAGDLAPGTYDGWIEVHAPWCHECEHVVFTVPQGGPSSAAVSTWGRVKARFR